MRTKEKFVDHTILEWELAIEGIKEIEFTAIFLKSLHIVSYVQGRIEIPFHDTTKKMNVQWNDRGLCFADKKFHNRIKEFDIVFPE